MEACNLAEAQSQSETFTTKYKIPLPNRSEYIPEEKRKRGRLPKKDVVEVGAPIQRSLQI